MIEARWRLAACVSALVCATGVDAASRLTKVVDTFDQVPGEGTGVTFVLPGTAAAHTSGIFVFQAEVSGVKGLWRTGPAPAAFTRLVDGNTAIPAGSGFFRDLVPFRFDGSSVVFRGDDQFEFGGQAGYYAQPVAGGAPTMLANQGTLVPPANTVTFGTNIGFPGGTQEQMALDAGTLVFADDREAGNYAIPVPAGPVRALGTTAFAICETGNYLALIWANPEISGNTVVMGIGGAAPRTHAPRRGCAPTTGSASPAATWPCRAEARTSTPSPSTRCAWMATAWSSVVETASGDSASTAAPPMART
jgi:hypothetical protein